MCKVRNWWLILCDKGQNDFPLERFWPLSCFQSVFQRGLDILNPVDLFLVKMLLKFFLYFLNIFFEEFVSSRRVSSFIKPFFSWPLIGGKMRSMYIEMLKSVGLKCVPTPKNWRTFKPFPLCTLIVSRISDFVFTSERPHYSLALFSSFIYTCTFSKKIEFASKRTLGYIFGIC